MTSIVFAHKNDINGQRRIVLNFPRIKKVIGLIKTIEGVEYDEVNDIWHIPATYRLKALNEQFAPELFFTWDVYQPTVFIKKYQESDKLIIKLPAGIEFDFKELGFETAEKDKTLGVWIIRDLDNLRTLENVLVSLGTTPVIKNSSPFEELEELPEIQEFIKKLEDLDLSRYAKNAYIFHIKQFVTKFGYENLSELKAGDINKYIDQTIKNYNISPIQKVYLTQAIKVLYVDILHNKEDEITTYGLYPEKVSTGDIEDILQIMSDEEKLLVILKYVAGVKEQTLAFTSAEQLSYAARDIKEYENAEQIFKNSLEKIKDADFLKNKDSEVLRQTYAAILEKYKPEILFKNEFENAIVQLKLKDSSKKSYRSIFKTIIRDFNYTHPLNWNGKFIESKLEQLQVAKKLTNETIVQYYNTIKIFYEKYLNTPAPKIKLPEKEDKSKSDKQEVLLTKDQLIELFNSSENLKNFTIIFFVAFTGIKTNVVIDILLKDLDLENNIIYIEAKNGKEPFHISQYMKQLLEHYLEVYKPTVFLFEGYKGSYSPSGLRKILKLTAENAKLKEAITFKNLTRSIIKISGGTNTYTEKKHKEAYRYDEKIAALEKEILDKTNWKNLE